MNFVFTQSLCLEMWAIRNNRLNWLNTTDIYNETEEGVIADAIIDVPEDPVFEGLDTSGPVPWMYSTYDVMNVNEAGNGTVLARMESDSSVLFVRWEPDDVFYDETFDYPANPRTLIGNGRDNSGTEPFDYYNFTEESEMVFFAEVARMFELGGGIPPTAVQTNRIRPSTCVLFQNYPNPFNPATNIEFSLFKPSHAIVQVFNVTGQLVETLIDQDLEAGMHTIHFQGGNLPTGMYFYKIKADNFTNIKKMMLVK